MPRWSPYGWPRPSWASHPTGASSPTPQPTCTISSPGCPGIRATSCAGSAWPTPWSGFFGVFSEQSPGFYDDLLLIDSTAVECARSRETTRRSALSDVADYGDCPSHSHYFWGEPLYRVWRGAGEILLRDKGYAGAEFALAVSDLGATMVRPRRTDEPGEGLHLAPIRQRIESIFWTCKDILTLERHGARSVAALESAYCSAFYVWQPASASTTSWVGPAVFWSAAAPEGVESSI